MDIMTDEPSEKKYEDNTLYKRWYRGRDRGGFIALSPWYEAGKIKIDVGETGADEKLKGHTEVWATLISLALYLKAVYDGVATELYPADKDRNLTAEGFLSYGGGGSEHGIVSRQLKIAYANEGDPSLFVWKVGVFEGRTTPSGAVLPVRDGKMISLHSIRVPRLEMAEIGYRMDVGLRAYAANNLQTWAQDKRRAKS